jgi:D-alanyl-D-alanine carboxypeptidase
MLASLTLAGGGRAASGGFLGPASRPGGARWLALLMLAGSVACAHRLAPPGLAAARPVEATSNAGAPGDIVVDSTLAGKIDALAARNTIPIAGASVAVARGNRIVVAKGYGKARLDTGAPATAATIYRIGSLTKQFTAALALQLVAEGQLSLDDPLDKYLPDFPTAGRTVRLRNLLSHTSGIHNYTDGDSESRWATQAVTPAALIATFRDAPSEFAPGTRWAYSNSNYVLIGAILERVTGRRYADLLADRITRPLGLTSTFYCSNQPSRPEEASGYRVVAGTIVPAAPIDMSRPFAAGGICSSVLDLARWSYALRTGRVIPSALYAEMTTPTTLSNGTRVPYGLGLGIVDREGRTRIGHAGGINGFVSQIVTLPADDLTVVVLVNTEGPAAQVGTPAVVQAALALQR